MFVLHLITKHHTLYEEERERWRGAVGYLKDGMDEYEIMKGYHVRNDEIEKETMRVMWKSRQRHEILCVERIGNCMQGCKKKMLLIM